MYEVRRQGMEAEGVSGVRVSGVSGVRVSLASVALVDKAVADGH